MSDYTELLPASSNPYQLAVTALNDLNSRSLFKAWLEKSQILKEEILLSVVIDRMKSLMDIMAKDMSVLIEANMTAHANESEETKMTNLVQLRQMKGSIHNLVAELMTFGQQGRFDYLQFLMAEQYDALQTTEQKKKLVKALVIEFYTGKVSVEDQVAACLRESGTPHYRQSIFEMETMVSIAVPRLFVKVVELKAVLSSQLQQVNDLQGKILAGIVSAGIVLLQLGAAEVKKQVLPPACLDVCSNI